MVSLAGRTLGKYRLIEQLGRGGFASVYKAYQERLNRYIAIKVLHPHLVEGEDFLVRFEREAIAVAALRHPNIVIVHDFDVETDIYYMVMEFINGQSLKERLEQLNASGAYMPFADVRRIMDHIISALDYAHSQGMLHRDVKPSNVILNSAGDAFLTDFGIARILSNTQFTATGAMIGTPAYMSPEQGQGMSVSPASDVYSLGVMLFEFLTGQVPFDADTPVAIVLKHIRDPLPSVRNLRPDIPEAMERVINKSLAKDPDDRYKSPGEMMQALRAALDLVQPQELSQPSPPQEQEEMPALVSLDDPSIPPEVAAMDLERAKAPTLVAGDSTDIPPAGSPAEVEDIEPEAAEPNLEASKAPTLAVEGELLDIPVETIAVDEAQTPLEAELEAAKAPTVVMVSESSSALEGVELLPGEAGEVYPVEVPADQKKWPLPKLFGIAGIVLIGVTLLGILLFQPFRPRVEGTPAEGAIQPTIRPTRRPTLTPPLEPTEIPSAAQVEQEDPLGRVIYESGVPVRIASALIISGPNADLGTDSQYGVEIAIDFKGEIMGHPIELQAEDDGCNEQGGWAVAQKIVSDPTIIAVIGTSCSGAAVPMAEVISEAGYVMVSPSNTAPSLTNPDQAWKPGYLRTAHNDTIQGRAMAEFAISELGVTTSAAIHDGDPYTEELARVFADSFEELGGTITTFTAVTKGDTDMKPVLNAVAVDSPEFIYYPVFTAEGGFITKQAKEIAGLENTILSSADGMISSAAVEAIGEAGEGMYFSGPDLSFSGDIYERFLATYIDKYGSEPISIFHAHSFDAANMIFACIEEVGIDDNGTLSIGRQAMRDCLYETKDFQGITGNLTCNEYGNCGAANVSIYQLQNGEYVYIWP